MNLTKKFKEIVDEYNSKCELESDKIIFDKSSDSYHFRRLFTNLLTVNSDFILYSNYLDIIEEDEDLRKILEIVKEEKLKRNELMWNIEKSVGWVNGEILNYKEVSNFFNIKVDISKIDILHRDDELMTINLEDFKVENGVKKVSRFEDYISTLHIILQNIVKGNNVFFIQERDDDDEYVLYNVFILDVDKFKKSKYIIFEDNSPLVEKDIVSAYNELYISDKYSLGFSNRLYVEKYYIDNFEDCIELINKKDESIEKKITDILLEDSYNTPFEDIKISDNPSIIEIDTKYVKLIYKKKYKKLMSIKLDNFDFDDLKDLSEDMEVIEDEISKLL